MTEQAQIDETQTAMSTGARLKMARQAKGLECEDVARDLKLDLKLIEALESDDVEKLPQPVYTAGYIRNYARLVDLSADSMVADYVSQKTKDLPSLPTRVDSLPERYKRVAEALPRSFSIAAANARNATPVQYTAIAIGVLVAILLGWQTSRIFDAGEQAQNPQEALVVKGQDDAGASADATSQSGESAPTNSVAAKQTVGQGSAAANTASGLNSPAADSTLIRQEKSESVKEQIELAESIGISRNENTDQQLPGSKSDSPAQAEDGDDEVTYVEKELTLPGHEEEKVGDALALLERQNTTDLTLTFTRNSWVDIRDATGKRIIRKLGIAGNSQVVKGIAPFQVLLGYGHGVTIEYNGKAVDFSAFQGNTVARFTLEVPKQKEVPEDNELN